VASVAWDWWLNLRKWLGAGGTAQYRTPTPSTAAQARLPGTGHLSTEMPPAVSNSPGIQPATHRDEVELMPMVTHDLYTLSKAGTVNVVDLTLPHTLDIQEFDRLNESILALVRGEPEGQWVLDLSRLSYMGSAALGLMVNLRQQIKQSGGRLVLCGLSPQLLHIFKTCCMERLFKIVKSRPDAVAAAE
jgi:anti-anti-sigma factor